MTVPAAFLTSLAALPDGYVEGSAEARRYGVTVTRSLDARRQWLYDEELGGEVRLSFNLSLLESGAALRRCGVAAEKVTAFVIAFRRDKSKTGQTAALPGRSSPNAIDDRTFA